MEVSITLDIVRRLRFDTNALAAADHLLRTDLFEIIAGTPRFSDVRIMLWAGLQWEDRRLTLERVGELMDAEFKKPDGLRFFDLWNRICLAIRAAGPWGPPGNAESEVATAPPPSENGSSKPSAPPTDSSASRPPNSTG